MKNSYKVILVCLLSFMSTLTAQANCDLILNDIGNSEALKTLRSRTVEMFNDIVKKGRETGYVVSGEVSTGGYTSTSSRLELILGELGALTAYIAPNEHPAYYGPPAKSIFNGAGWEALLTKELKIELGRWGLRSNKYRELLRDLADYVTRNDLSNKRKLTANEIKRLTPLSYQRAFDNGLIGREHITFLKQTTDTISIDGMFNGFKISTTDFKLMIEKTQAEYKATFKDTPRYFSLDVVFSPHDKKPVFYLVGAGTVGNRFRPLSFDDYSKREIRDVFSKDYFKEEMFMVFDTAGKRLENDQFLPFALYSQAEMTKNSKFNHDLYSRDLSRWGDFDKALIAGRPYDNVSTRRLQATGYYRGPYSAGATNFTPKIIQNVLQIYGEYP